MRASFYLDLKKTDESTFFFARPKKKVDEKKKIRPTGYSLHVLGVASNSPRRAVGSQTTPRKENEPKTFLSWAALKGKQ